MAVIIVDNGQIAVEAASTGDFDLILMDIQTPIMDGLQATRAIRSAPRGANVPILAMTANAFEEDRQRCLLAGMNDHSAKPVEIDDRYTHLIAWLPIRRGELPEDSSAHAVWSDFVVESCGSSDADAIELPRGIDGLDVEFGLESMFG